MFRRSCLLICLVSVLLLSCSDDKGTTPSAPTETFLTSATIGSGGGSVATDDFTLTVPAGAFTGEVTLDLYDAGDDHTFGDDAISSVYRIKGLPDEIAQPLQISLRYEGTLSEESFIARSVEDDLALEDEPVYIYDFLTATDSNGFLFTEIPAQGSGSSSFKLSKSVQNVSTAGINKDDFVAIANHKLHVQTQHIKIIYPIYLIDYIADLGKFLEAGYDTVANRGFGWAETPWKWPITAKVMKITYNKSPVFMGLNIPRSVGQCPMIAFNENMMSSMARYTMQVAGGKAMFTVASMMYDRTKSSYINPQNAWLHVAMTDWSEGLFSDVPALYVPQGFPGAETALFKGLRAGAGSDYKTSAAHGFGVSPLFKFLMEDSRFGNDGLKRCYQYIKNGDDATTALIDALYDTENDWLPDFFRQYLQGNIYDVDAATFMADIDISETMNTANDTMEVFLDTYPDLSANLYLIELDANKLKAGSSISFEVDASQTSEDYVIAQVYRVKDGSIEFVSEGLNFSVTNVKEAATDGFDLIACVVNASNEAPYTGSSPIELTVRVVEAPAFTWCQIRVGLTVVMLDDNDTTHYEVELLEPGWTATGQMTENSFTWDIDSTFHGNTNTHGTMSVTIDPGSMTVFSFSANATSIDASGISRWSIAGTALPQEKYIPNSELTCRIDGTATYGRITDFQWSYESYISHNTDAKSYRCKSTAYVSVSLKR